MFPGKLFTLFSHLLKTTAPGSFWLFRLCLKCNYRFTQTATDREEKLESTEKCVAGLQYATRMHKDYTKWLDKEIWHCLQLSHSHTTTHTLSSRCVIVFLCLCEVPYSLNPLAQPQKSQSPHPIICFSKADRWREGKQSTRERETELQLERVALWGSAQGGVN